MLSNAPDLLYKEFPENFGTFTKASQARTAARKIADRISKLYKEESNAKQKANVSLKENRLSSSVISTTVPKDDPAWDCFD